MEESTQRIGRTSFALGSAILVLAVTAGGAGLPEKTYPAGQLLSVWRDGGRLATWHNGHFYATGLATSHVYDISDPQKPVERTKGIGSNGHRWAKFRNAFWREYDNIDAEGGRFLDLSALPELKPHAGGPGIPQTGGMDIFGYPHKVSAGKLVDMRNGKVVGQVSPASLKTVTGSNQLRIGNLLFYCPGDNQAGVAAIDMGNPANPRILDELKGPEYKQYTTNYQVWRHYLILLFGDDTNAGGNNLIAIDFQDPENLKVAWGLKSAETGGARYAMFQDEFAFCGRANGGLKINLETRQTVQRFKTVGYNSDFQWIPLGHLVVQTASEEADGQTHIFSHQNALDTRPPTVGYHLPRPDAVNQPLGTVVGLVINETLEDSSVHPKTLFLRPVGGAPIAADVVSYSYNVINIVPREPLAANTSYEVEVAAGGIRDVAGNAMAGFRFYFSTGATVNRPAALLAPRGPMNAALQPRPGLFRRDGVFNLLGREEAAPEPLPQR